MQPVLTVFKREFFGYFRSPVAYVFLVAFIVATIALAWFLGSFFEANNASLRSFFVFLPFVYLVLIPAAGMRLWAEEKRSGTWELLFTMPLSTTQAVLGKFLAGWAFVSIAAVMTFTMPLTVAYLGDPDWGPVFSGYLGAILMAGAYLSICSLASALTKNQVISFVASVCVCLVFVLIGWSVFNGLMQLVFPIGVVDALANFGFVPHFEMMSKGLVRTGDLVYFLSIMAFCLGLNVAALER